MIDALPAFATALAAAATLLAEARERMTEAARVGDAAGVEERNAAAAEARAEQAEGRLADARTAAAAAEDRYGTERDVWFADPRGVALDLSAIASSTIDRDAVSGFPGRVREVAAGPEAELAADRASAAAAGAAARQLEATLRERRSRVAAVEDPVPPSPAWARDPRDGNSLALWRLVDLRVEIAPDHRAGLEAALEAAGLLDALVLPDGQLLHADTHDVVLRPAVVADGPTLSRYLQPDVPAGSPVQAATVASVLDSVAAGDSPVGDPVAWVGLDGSFRLGPLHGRGGKPAAQYLGASARAAERARRLLELDGEIDAAVAGAEQAEGTAATLAGQLAGLRAWVAAAPAGRELLDTWLRLEHRAVARDEASADAGAAADRAERARRRHQDAERAAREAAARAGVTPDPALIAARLENATRARRRADRLPDEVARLTTDRTGWATTLGRAAADRAAADASVERAARAVADARTEHDRYEAAAAAADPLLRDLSNRIDQTRTAMQAARREAERLEVSIRRLIGAVATADAESRSARQARDLARTGVDAAETEFRATAGVTGLLAAASDPQQPGSEAAGPGDLAAALAAVAPGTPVLRLARSWSGRLAGGARADLNALHQAGDLARAGAAADLNPRLLVEQELWSAQADHLDTALPVTVAVQSLAAAVAEDRELLSTRERRMFEQHLLGDLGEALRGRLLEAEELVAATNRILGTVTTSQGIAVRLGWTIRQDAGAGPAEAVDLLRRMTQLSQAERERLRDVMHGIIESARAAAPELSYTDHLQSVLDYRSWFAFTVRISRPEWAGDWRPLTARTGLSQGEQKVACYLPLFAAAAAHFTSVAGAHSPYAPRFILLDDAFPKIDVRTHPLLFGLLVDLDLDFVITSERLWGDTPRLPSLAIYETLRSPGEVGIAQYEYRWDGARRHAVDR